MLWEMKKTKKLLYDENGLLIWHLNKWINAFLCLSVMFLILCLICIGHGAVSLCFGCSCVICFFISLGLNALKKDLQYIYDEISEIKRQSQL